MGKKIFAGLALAGATLVAVPASAAIVICTGTGQQCAPQTDANILLTSGTDLDKVQGSFNGGGTTATGFFDSSENLNADAEGQATISATNGSVLNDLSFTLNDGATFGTATFNLFAGGTALLNESTQVSITTSLGGTRVFDIGTNGSNFFGITGTEGERFTSFSFVGVPNTTGIVDFRQLRLGDVQPSMMSAVPEPTTWAFMLVGFGAVGYSMRRRPTTKVSFATA